MLPRLLFTLLCALALPRVGAARSLEVSYPAATAPGELAFASTFHLWIPDGVKTLRGVIVHQHGCGAGSAKAAATAADDLHWQALARKWDCALIGPQYHMGEKDSCRKWCDPRNGSDVTFRRALADLAQASGHAELATVPWCLWGHSGGGFWSSLMLALHPERIVAIWLRSGSAYGAWTKGEIPAPEFTPAMFGVPMMFNGGGKEAEDKVHGPPRIADRAMFQLWREKGAPAAYAMDPRTGHECGDTRYLAIPFFDACLALRLPEKAGHPLREIDRKAAWFAPMFEPAAKPAAQFTGDLAQASWLPGEAFAKQRAQYLATGATSDTTPPPSPKNLRVHGAELSWEAEADFESGLQGFLIERDGAPLAQLPEKPLNKAGRPLFQGLSGGDTPALNPPAMRFVDATAKAGESHRYRVIAVNGVGLKSTPTTAAP